MEWVRRDGVVKKISEGKMNVKKMSEGEKYKTKDKNKRRKDCNFLWGRGRNGHEQYDAMGKKS